MLEIQNTTRLISPLLASLSSRPLRAFLYPHDVKSIKSLSCHRHRQVEMLATRRHTYARSSSSHESTGTHAGRSRRLRGIEYVV